MLAMLLVVGVQAQQAQRQFENQSAQRGLEAASDLIGARIENPQGDNLGSVSDLAVDPQSGQVAYVILSRGGVLGIGAKLYPIPWQAARYNRQNERIVVDLSENQLDSAPNFSGDSWPDLASPTWRQRVHSFYQTRGMGGSQEQFHRQQDNMNGSGGPRQMDNDNEFNRRTAYEQGATRAPMGSDGADVVTSSRLIRASKLMDKSLRNTQDQRIGSIEDLAIDLSSGKVEYAVVGAGGGFLGMDKDLHAVPWDAVRYDASRETIMLDASKQKIENAPSFKRDEWSNLSDPAWQSRVDRYYGAQGSQDEFRGEPMDQGRFQDGGQLQPQD
jgi:sporulation protein YlmC with PRC-barrel domain